MSYTKEEWKVEGTTVYALEFDSWSRGKEVFRNRWSAHVQGYRDVPDAELLANARLMAAAPELLEALQEMILAVGGIAPSILNHIKAYEKAQSAIEKALGE